MGRVVRCPACGEIHSLEGLAADPTFSCTQCGRTLRTPTELVAPGGADAPVASPAKPRSSAVPTSVRIAAWVAAVVVGLFFAWLVATGFGLLSRAVLVDMFRSSTATNYWRLALFVPLWAFMTATSATLLIEGIRWFRARRAGDRGGRPRESGQSDQDHEPGQPALSRTVPEVDESMVADRRPSSPPGRRTRIRPSEPTP